MYLDSWPTHSDTNSLVILSRHSIRSSDNFFDLNSQYREGIQLKVCMSRLEFAMYVVCTTVHDFIQPYTEWPDQK